MPNQGQYLFDSPLPVLLSGVSTTLYHNGNVTGLVLAKVGTTGDYGGFVSNPSQTAMAYLQCFNAATTGAVTLGMTVPQDVFHIPPMSGFGDKWASTVGYPLGLVIAATTDVNNATLVSTALKASLYIS